MYRMSSDEEMIQAMEAVSPTAPEVPAPRALPPLFAPPQSSLCMTDPPPRIAQPPPPGASVRLPHPPFFPPALSGGRVTSTLVSAPPVLPGTAGRVSPYTDERHGGSQGCGAERGVEADKDANLCLIVQ